MVGICQNTLEGTTPQTFEQFGIIVGHDSNIIDKNPETTQTRRCPNYRLNGNAGRKDERKTNQQGKFIAK